MKRGTILSTNKSTFKSTINRNDIKENILEILRNSEKPISTAEISSRLGKSWHTIIRYCLDLELEGKIFKFEIGRIAVWQVKK
jgi:hypothetical protein